MATDNSPVRIVPIIATVVRRGRHRSVVLKFVFDSYFLTMMEGEEHRRSSGHRAGAAQRAARSPRSSTSRPARYRSINRAMKPSSRARRTQRDPNGYIGPRASNDRHGRRSAAGPTAGPLDWLAAPAAAGAFLAAPGAEVSRRAARTSDAAAPGPRARECLTPHAPGRRTHPMFTPEFRSFRVSKPRSQKRRREARRHAVCPRRPPERHRSHRDSRRAWRACAARGWRRLRRSA